MSEESRCCSKCRWPLGNGDACFCPNCGCDLGAMPEPGEMAGKSASPIMPSTAPAIGGESLDKGRSFDRMDSTPSRPVLDGNTECDDLEICYNASRLFVEGLEMPFQFRIKPTRDGISDLCIEIRRRQAIPRGDLLVARDEPAWIPSRGKTMDNPVGFRPEPGSAGLVTFDIYIGYTVEGVRSWFLARKTHTVFQPKAHVDSVIKELNIQFRNELQQGHAGDAQVHQTLHGIENLIQTKKDYVEDFRGVEVPELWVRLSLARCLYKPITGDRTGLGQPPPAAVVSRLKLCGKGGAIHLLAGRSLTLGRNRGNDIVTRFTLPDGSMPPKPNERISRYHCQIKLNDNHCVLIDQGWDPSAKVSRPSALGIMLDDRVVSRGQSVGLPLDRDFTITLAPTGRQDDDVYVLQGRVWTCGAMGEATGCRKSFSALDPAGLVLQVRDKPEEVYVLLWAYLRLARVVSGGWDVCVCRAGDAFILESDSRCDWLVPGQAVSMGIGRSLDVVKYVE